MPFAALLYAHVAGGALALLVGAAVLTRRKGDRLHKRLGWLFAGGMLLAGATSLAMAVLRPNAFLFIVGVFTLYMVGTGLRYNRLRGLLQRQRPRGIDYGLTGAMGLFAVAFLVYGVHLLTRGNTMGTVLLTFGAISALFVWQDARNYRGGARSPKYWLLMHVSRMTGAYIAAFTAFLAVNIGRFPDAIPGFVIWLAPTAILTPLIIRWSRRVRLSAKPNETRG